MNAEKIKQIIEQENEEREACIARRAREIIIAITKGQEQIADINKSIVVLREELKSLEVNPLDPKSITGA